MNFIKSWLLIAFYLFTLPVWSGEGVVIGDREWLQPADFVNYSFNQVESTCPPPSGACSGSLPDSDVDLTGHRWASMADIAELFNMAGIIIRPPVTDSELADPPGFGDPPDLNQALQVNQDVLFGYFEPTYKFLEGGPQNVLIVISSDRADIPAEYQGLVVQYGIIGDGDSSLDDSGDDTGIWFWRPLGETTEPPAEKGITVSGTVTTGGGANICALVLASGQYMFSCDPPGSYFLRNLPTEHDGTVKRQIYARGFFPKIDVLQESTSDAVTLERATNCPDYNLPSDPLADPQSSGDRHSVSGRVLLQSTDMPVCSLVLANGSHMFSCNDTGTFSLDFPLDENGQYTLQAYADGFAPSVRVFNTFDSPQEVRMAKASECDAVDAPDIVIADDKEWLQPILFRDLSWIDISAVCSPVTGVCSGALKGYTLDGWTWASVEDVNALFNFYIGRDELGPGGDIFTELESEWLPAFFDDGWRSAYSNTNHLEGLTRELFNIEGFDEAYAPRIGTWANFEAPEIDTIDTASDLNDYEAALGAWFYRNL